MDLKYRIEQAPDLPSEIVTIPEWGDMQVKIKGMDVKSRMQWERHILGPGGQVLPDRNAYEDMIIPMLVVCLYDPETDQPAFASEEEGMQVLLGKNATVLARLAETARRLSGIGVVEEQAKN